MNNVYSPINIHVILVNYHLIFNKHLAVLSQYLVSYIVEKSTYLGKSKIWLIKALIEGSNNLYASLFCSGISLSVALKKYK